MQSIFWSVSIVSSLEYAQKRDATSSKALEAERQGFEDVRDMLLSLSAYYAFSSGWLDATFKKMFQVVTSTSAKWQEEKP